MQPRSLGAYCGVGALLLALAAGTATAFAQSPNDAPPGEFGSAPSGPYPILYDDHHVYAKPNALVRGRVLGAIARGGILIVPLRSMFEQLGATVSYDSGSKTVTVSKPGAEVKVTVGKPEVVINGETRPLDVPPMIYQGAVLVPIRVISEGMGAYVQWVPDRRLVVVRYVPPSPPPSPAPPPPPPPPPTPTPGPSSTPGPISDSTFGVYDANHPEYGLLSGQQYYGRYSYVLLFLNGNDSLNIAMLQALVHRYVAPGQPIIPGIPMNTENPHEFNVFEVPVLSSAWRGVDVSKTDAAKAAYLKSVYDWKAAVRIRDRYCAVTQHASFARICTQPRDSGPLIVTFFAPIPKLQTLRPAFAYDFTNAPADTTIVGSVLDVIQTRISLPNGVSADQVLPPSEQLKVAELLEGANAALASGQTHVLAFAEKISALKKLFSP